MTDRGNSANVGVGSHTESDVMGDVRSANCSTDTYLNEINFRMDLQYYAQFTQLFIHQKCGR